MCVFRSPVISVALTDTVGALHSRFFLVGQESRGVTFEH